MSQRELEMQQLQATLALISQEEATLQALKAQHQAAFLNASLENGSSENKINAFSQESLWESYFARRDHEQDLLIRYHTAEAQGKRLTTLKVMKKNPYFARIDFLEDQEKNKLYLGIASLRDEADETIVVDWRSPIANLYYESQLGKTFYVAQNEKIKVELLLKRQFKIANGQLLSMVDTSDTINDDFLLDILEENSSNHMKNIVATIQKAQNEIIRNTQSHVMLIEGIAGSGKTSALLQRVAYLLYTHRNWLKTNQVLLFSPNHLFSEYIAEVLPSLGESQIPTETFVSYFQQLLPQFALTRKTVAEREFLAGEKSVFSQLKADLALLPLLENYLKKITPMGPLFLDLKIKGDVVLSKEKIRQYYQETNELLPLYQRISLLQTKLYKKLGGLAKDEEKKPWVKEALQEKLQKLFENNPQMNDDHGTLQKLRRKLTTSIVQKHFKKVKRQIDAFSFVAFNRQYLHFISTLPEEFLAQFAISPSLLKEELQNLKNRFKNRELLLEDAPLFLLLKKRLAPFYPENKARFIFVDEMQDVTPLEALVLKELHETANFTFCGDLNQQIFGNPTLVTEMAHIFPDKNISHYQLTTSYRSTAEITSFAESFLKTTTKTDAPRHGKKPRLIFKDDPQDLANELIQALKNLPENHDSRLAILTKTTAEAEKLGKILSQTSLNYQVILNEEDYFKRKIVILPAFLAKGLEFDSVFCYGISTENFNEDSDRLILYTMITRGMHEVTLFIAGKKLPFRTFFPE